MPVKKIFFQSSFPRSGSTLLQNILAQNTDIYTTPTSGLLELIYGAQNNFTNSSEFRAQSQNKKIPEAFRAFCKNGMQAYFDALTDKPFVIDKSRGWGIHYHLLAQILDYQPKIICMVRDPRDILASMEKNFRKYHNGLNQNLQINWHTGQNTTLPKRIDNWIAGPPVGLAFDRFHEIVRYGWDRHILFVQYENLCKNPQSELNRIYDYLEIDRFEHNFDHIEQVTIEDDEVYGDVKDLHEIRTKLEMKPSDARKILGTDIYNWAYEYNHINFICNYFRYKK